MDIYKVTVAINGRDLEALVKAGVLATIETGSLDNGAETPRDKVTIIVGQGKQRPTAWIQVSRFAAGRVINVTHEGWISEGVGALESCSSLNAANTSLSKVVDPSAEVMKCQGEAAFGARACCTRTGSGCYVTCCGGCCSDPFGCPGASCCP
jgi:hypothetical protein